jgi:hypothetical protein
LSWEQSSWWRTSWWWRDRSSAVDERVEHQRGADLRKVQWALVELNRVDREEPAVRSQCASANVDEAAEPEEKVGQLEVISVEDHVDRHHLVSTQRGRALRRDRVESDPALARDCVQLEHDSRFVGLIWHGFRQPEEIGHTNLLRVLGFRQERARVADLAVLGGNLGGEV